MRRLTRVAAASLVAAAWLVPSRASAAPFEEPERRVALWVPPLRGEVGARFGVDSRLALGDAEELLLPGTMARLDAAARLYLDPRGAFGVGLYGGGGVELPLSGQEVGGTLSQLGGGISFQYRAISEDYLYAVFGSFIELHHLTWQASALEPWETADPRLPGRDGGLRVAVGIELGPGLLAWLDPYIMGESVVRFGLEYARFGGAELTSLVFGWSLAMEGALR